MTRNALPTPPWPLVANRPEAWPDAPTDLTFSTLKEIESCPRRWALSNASYPSLWNGRGYPQRLQLHALAGTIVHAVLEAITRELVAAGCPSVQDAAAVGVLQRLGGFSQIVRKAIEEVLERSKANPRAAILTFALLFGNVLMPLRDVHRILDELHESTLKVRDFLAMMDIPVDKSFNVASPGEPHLVLGAPMIEARDLQLEYTSPDGSSTFGMRRVTLEVRHGETIGVAGPSGAGKSTWLRALLRLAHPGAGELLIGGVSIESLSRQAIGHLIGYVGQTPFLFSGTIRENIAYGCSEFSETAICQAAERAGIHAEIMAMPGQYSAVVTERGGTRPPQAT